MKSKIKTIVVLAIYISLMIICTNVYAATGTTTKETVRLREKASTDSATVTLIPIDKEVEIIEQDGKWYSVKYEDGENTYTGYIRQDMLDVEGNIEKTSDSETNQKDNNQDEDNTTSNDNNQDENNTATGNTTSDNTTDNTTSDQSNNGSSNNAEVSTVTEIVEGTQLTISENIEIRILPLINTSVTGTLKANTEILATEIIGNWCYIEAKNQSGWVMTSKIKAATTGGANEGKQSQPSEEENNEEPETTQDDKTNNTTTETKDLYVSATTVNLREEANSSSKILQQLPVNTKVTVIEKVDNTWSKVEVANLTGYVATQYLSETKTETTSRGSDETRKEENTSASTSKENKTTSNQSSETKKETTSSNSTTSSSKKENSTTANESKNTTSNKEDSTSSTSSKTTGSDVVAYAKTFLGCKYVYGGTSPSGFDCSGFTQYVYKHFGYSLSRTSSAQRSNGVAVSKSNLKAGDIVCFSGHVGIYVGGNQFIHAENPANGVTISLLSESYYTSTYITARRIIQ